MNELEKIMNLIIKEKGGTQNDYRLLLELVGYLESNNIVDRKQMDGGPARGIYQYEMGKKESAVSAVNRAITFLKDRKQTIPKWLQNESIKKDVDFSKLTKDQQSILFLTDKMQRKGADFSKLWSGEQSVEDFYLDSHWAGQEEKRAEKGKYFRGALQEYAKDQEDPITFDSKVLINSQEEYPDYVNNTPLPKEKLYNDISLMQTQDNIKPVLTPEPQQNTQLKPLLSGPGTSDLFPEQNTFETGGIANSIQDSENILTTYDEGGSHESNPNGGIPIGIGQNGQMNTVQEGESSFESKEGKYIFSNNIFLNGKIKK